MLTCLPAPALRTPAAVGRLLTHDFPAGLAGGSLYDALVGATAAEHGVVLVTRDRRALATYRALDVDVELMA